MRGSATVLACNVPSYQLRTETKNSLVYHLYWVVGTHAMRAMGGDYQKQWCIHARVALNRGQRADGSWQPHTPIERAGGRVYATALAVHALATVLR